LPVEAEQVFQPTDERGARSKIRNQDQQSSQAESLSYQELVHHSEEMIREREENKDDLRET
jgi:hypothetical protein